MSAHETESDDSSDYEYKPEDEIVNKEDSSQSEDECDDVEDDLCPKPKKKIEELKPQLTIEEQEKKDKELFESLKTYSKNTSIEKSKIENTSKSNSNLSIDLPKSNIQNTNNSQILKPAKRPVGGLNLNSILGGAKKPKLNTLEKSKQDWQKFVENEGIQDDLKIHNKGKDGYLERKAFEARTDLNRYEIERGFRMKSNNTNNKQTFK